MTPQGYWIVLALLTMAVCGTLLVPAASPGDLASDHGCAHYTQAATPAEKADMAAERVEQKLDLLLQR